MDKIQEQKNAEWRRRASKQLTPKRVIRRWQNEYACCPVCGRGVVREANLCCNCGQALDWSFD